MTDLAAIRERHTPYNVEARRILGVERCRSDRQEWPCDAAQLLALLADTPSVEPLDVERLMFAIHRSGIAGCPEDCTSALDEYPSGADSDYATFLAREYAASALARQASDSPEKTT